MRNRVRCIQRSVEWSFTQAPDPGLPSYEENIMTRKYIDCREFPSESKCSVAMSARYSVTGRPFAGAVEMASQGPARRETARACEQLAARFGRKNDVQRAKR